VARTRRKKESPWVRSVRRIAHGLALYIAASGLVTFSLFICEEAIQTTMFGSWPASDAGQWGVVEYGCAQMEAICSGMETINAAAGWINPLAWYSYDKYAEATRYYVRAKRAEAFARAPEVYDGKVVEFEIVATSEKGAGRIVVEEGGLVAGERARIRGRIRVEGGRVYVSPRDVRDVREIGAYRGAMP